MILFEGGGANTPVKKVRNKNGRPTLMQDPLNVLPGDDVTKRNINARTTPTGGSSGSSGGAKATPVSEGGGYGGGGGFDLGAYLAALMAQRQAAAQAAYDRSMSRIAAGYGSAYDSLKGNYDSAVDRLNASRDKSMHDVNYDAENSLRQAYINNMLTKKNMNQRLSAMGYNGGATESTMASLENQYRNSRTNINEMLNKNIADLNASYGDNLAQALQSFNSAKANLDLQRMQMEMAAENALTNAQTSDMSGVFGMDSSYLTALQNAIANQGGYAYNPTEATNNYVAGNVQQAQNASEGANYAKYLAQAQLDAANGNTLNRIKTNLFNEVRAGNLGIDTLNAILSKLGAA